MWRGRQGAALGLLASGGFGADVTVTAWQTTPKNYKFSETSWDTHQATDWPTQVSWKVEGQDAGGLLAFSGTTRVVLMDPNLDNDTYSQSQGDCEDHTECVAKRANDRSAEAAAPW